MRLPLLLSLSLPLLSGQTVRAQLAPADDFFHSGAQFYISNNIPAAKAQVEMGLKLYPDDDKLKKLEQLLKQQQQQQNQQQQNQQSQSQQSKDQQQSQQQKSDGQKDQSQQNSADQQKPDEQQQAAQKKADEEKKAEQQKASAEKKDGEKPDEQKGEGQPMATGQMTPEEAKRLLDAQKGNEQFLQLKPQDKPRDVRRPVKDW
jgi:Ca-activated chloride channel family protein